jgi:hypothetical protein
MSQEKVALATGVSSGIGRAIALRFQYRPLKPESEPCASMRARNQFQRHQQDV